jgi:hypothetical protein
MERLKYELYRETQDILSIDLHNGYSIIAIKIWNKENQNYTVELYLKKNDIDTWKLVEEAESLEFDTNYKFINSAILKTVAEMLLNGFFDYYIERYKYEMACFDKGNELFEQESLNDAC